MTNRAERRAMVAGKDFFRVVPMFKNTEGDDLEDSVQTSIVDGDFEGTCLIVRVPVTCSTAQARTIEKRLTEALGKNVIVVTRNIEICRVEEISKSEVAKLMKGTERVEPTREEVKTMESGQRLHIIDKRSSAGEGPKEPS